MIKSKVCENFPNGVNILKIELNWIELNWAELNLTEMYWIEFDFFVIKVNSWRLIFKNEINILHKPTFFHFFFASFLFFLSLFCFTKSSRVYYKKGRVVACWPWLHLHLAAFAPQVLLWVKSPSMREMVLVYQKEPLLIWCWRPVRTARAGCRRGRTSRWRLWVGILGEETSERETQHTVRWTESQWRGGVHVPFSMAGPCQGRLRGGQGHWVKGSSGTAAGSWQ